MGQIRTVRPCQSTNEVRALLCVVCAAAASVLVQGGCQTATKTTQLQTRDFQDISTEIAASLQSSEFIRERTPESPPMTIAIQKIDNLTTDILSEGEKWFLMDRVMNSDVMSTLRRQRNIRFVVPAERLDGFAERQQWAGPIAPDRRPTHVMTATMRSVTRAQGFDRTDLYSAQYSITRVETGETAWRGEYLLKRAATGRSYN